METRRGLSVTIAPVVRKGRKDDLDTSASQLHHGLWEPLEILLLEATFGHMEEEDVRNSHVDSPRNKLMLD